MADRHPMVKNLRDIEGYHRERGTKFGFSGKRIGVEAGNTAVGCTWYELPPGKQAFPKHYHCANEESLFILEGYGEVTIGEEVVKIEKDDFISFPPGPEYAHCLKNTGDTPLRYLCLSSMLPTDVVGYPDSKKIGVFGSPEAGKGFFSSSWIMKIVKDGENLDYYDGEDIE